MFLIGGDDVAHQAVAGHVLALQVHELNPVDALEDVLHLDKAAGVSVLQVGLRNVARHDGPAVGTKPGQKHLHLTRGGVLCLVENDERGLERPAPHVGEGDHLHPVLLQGLGQLVAGHHLPEGVVERAEVRRHLFVEVARQKPELLPGLHGGAGEDNLVHLVVVEGGDGQRHGHVRLPGAGGPDGEHHIVGRGRLDEALLVGGAGLDDLPVGGGENQVARAGIRRWGRGARVVRIEQGQNRVDVLLGEVLVALEKGHHLAEDPLNLFQRLRLAFEVNLRAPGRDLGVRECILDLSEVNVVEAEQEKRIGTVNAQLFFGQRDSGPDERRVRVRLRGLTGGSPNRAEGKSEVTSYV